MFFNVIPLSPSRLCYYVKEHTKPALALPQTSSQRREYVPMRFVESNAICGSGVMLIENCSMYMFGILESVVHMAWMRALTGRLKEDYRYSSIMVYNNLPWLTPTLEQKEKIEKTAQAILDARANHSDNSLVDLYDPLLMPDDLRKAHKANDKAVLQLYGLNKDASEQDIVAHLFKLYEDLTNNND